MGLAISMLSLHTSCPLPHPAVFLVCDTRLSSQSGLQSSLSGCLFRRRNLGSPAVHPELSTPDRPSHSHCLGLGAVEKKFSHLERAHRLVGKPSLQPKMLRASGQESLSRHIPPPVHHLKAPWDKQKRIKWKYPEEELEECAWLISWDKGCMPTACHTVLPVCVMSLPKTSPHSKGGYCCVSCTCPCRSPPAYIQYPTVGLCSSLSCATFSMPPRFLTILPQSRGLADQGVWP